MPGGEPVAIWFSFIFSLDYLRQLGYCPSLGLENFVLFQLNKLTLNDEPLSSRTRSQSFSSMALATSRVFRTHSIRGTLDLRCSTILPSCSVTWETTLIGLGVHWSNSCYWYLWKNDKHKCSSQRKNAELPFNSDLNRWSWSLNDAVAHLLPYWAEPILGLLARYHYMYGDCQITPGGKWLRLIVLSLLGIDSEAHTRAKRV